jgi:hypothetical protein
MARFLWNFHDAVKKGLGSTRFSALPPTAWPWHFPFGAWAFCARSPADNRKACRMRFIYCADHQGTSPAWYRSPTGPGSNPAALCFRRRGFDSDGSTVDSDQTVCCRLGRLAGDRDARKRQFRDAGHVA